MNKKHYEKPAVKKVTLEIKKAVLDVCNTSTDNAFAVPGTPPGGCIANRCFSSG
jgi:hypothetical protein